MVKVSVTSLAKREMWVRIPLGRKKPVAQWQSAHVTVTAVFLPFTPPPD